MPFRPMTDKEIEDTDKLISKIDKEIERWEISKASLEARKKEGIWYSDVDWSKKP